jgi:hypothetical protein
MLYMTADELHIVVLETANLEELKKGRPAKTPDGKVLICWTPDPVWLADKILATNGDGEQIAKLIAEAAERPQKPNSRPRHEPYVKTFLGEPDGTST